MKTLFELGQVVATSGALQAATDASIDLLALLRRHASGDWGVCCEEDKKANEHAVSNGLRILSMYPIEGSGERL